MLAEPASHVMTEINTAKDENRFGLLHVYY